MAKGIIKANLGSGRYNIDIDRDMTVVNAKIDKLIEKIDKLNDDLVNIYPPKLDEINSKIQALNDQLEFATDAQANRIIKDLIPLRLELQRVTDQQTIARIDKENYSAQKSKLITLKGVTNQDCWCVDYTTDLEEGMEVGITNFHYHRETALSDPVILPNSSKVGDRTGTSKYNPLRDGALVPQQGLSVNAWWYAMSSYRGVEKHLPRYRKGTITAIDSINNNCTVQVDGHEPLSNVPIRYFGCDSSVFISGDRVVIQYPIKDIHEKLSKRYESIRDAIFALGGSLDQLLLDLNNELTQVNSEITTATDRMILIEAALASNEISDQFRSDLTSELHYLRIEFNYLNGRKTVLDNRKQSLTIQRSSLAEQSSRVVPLVASEMGKSAKLQPLIKQFPDVPTVIGFVSHPKPCGFVVAYQQLKPDIRWKRITPEGYEANLNYTPPMTGDFNRGLPNVDGKYDCACMWSGQTFYHNGILYQTDITITAAAVKKIVIDKKAHYQAFFTFKEDKGRGFLSDMFAYVMLPGTAGFIETKDHLEISDKIIAFSAFDAGATMLVGVERYSCEVGTDSIDNIIKTNEVKLTRIDEQYNFWYTDSGYGDHIHWRSMYYYPIEGAKSWGIDKHGRISFIAFTKYKPQDPGDLSIWAVEVGTTSANLVRVKTLPKNTIQLWVVYYVVQYPSGEIIWHTESEGDVLGLMEGILGFDAYSATLVYCGYKSNVLEWYVNDKKVHSVSHSLSPVADNNYYPIYVQDMDDEYTGGYYNFENQSELIGHSDQVSGIVHIYKNNWILVRGKNGEKSKVVNEKSQFYTLLM